MKNLGKSETDSDRVWTVLVISDFVTLSECLGIRIFYDSQLFVRIWELVLDFSVIAHIDY